MGIISLQDAPHVRGARSAVKEQMSRPGKSQMRGQMAALGGSVANRAMNGDLKVGEKEALPASRRF